MRLLTPTGPTILRAKAYPLTGVDYPKQYQQGNWTLNLGHDVNQTAKIATYTRLLKANPWVNAAVSNIASGLARSPIRLYETLNEDEVEEIRWDVPKTGRPTTGMDLSRQLTKSYKRVGPQRRMRATGTDYLLYGNALWTGVLDPGFTHIPWTKIKVHEGTTEPIESFEYVGDHGSKFFSPEEVVHFSTSGDPEAPIGMSPLEPLNATLALHTALYEHLVKFFENSARPSGNLKLQPGANSETIDLIREQIQELYTSPDNAGKVIVTTGDYQPLTADHEHSEVVELVKLSREEIAAAFHIPPPVLGMLENAHYANVRELREQFYRDVVGVWAAALEDDIQAQVIDPNPTYRKLYIRFDNSDNLKPNMEKQAEAFKDLETTITTNERRKSLGLKRLDHPEADTVPRTPGGGYLGIDPPEPLPETPGVQEEVAPVEAVSSGSGQEEDDGSGT